MAEAPAGTIEQLRAIWVRLTVPQRISIVLFGGGVMIGLILLVIFMNGQEYQTLYSGLSSEDAGAVVAKLKERKVPYQVGEGGIVKVPTDKINEIRIQLASEGLPQSGRIGFEIFDKTNFGITDFTAQVNYRRALEGELERTIRYLDEVAQVRVHLTLSKESLFSEKAEAAKASVFLRFKSGRQLATGSAAGITHLVSAAVEGLRPENVSILDTHAKVLSPVLSSDGVPRGLTAPEVEQQRQAEKDLTDKVISILEPVVGVGKVRANASMQLDFNSSELTEEVYNPNGNAVVSQQKSEEKMLAGAAMSGIPGTRSNQPGGSPLPTTTPAAPSPDARMKQNEITNFEVSRTVRHTTIPKGSIKKVSVAVVVDDKLVAKKDKKAAAAKDGVVYQPAPRSTEEMENLRKLVQAAAGFNKERGDQITVENIAFNSAPLPEADTPASFANRYSEYIKLGIRYGAIVFVVLLVYLIVLRPLMRQVLAPLQRLAVAETKALEPVDTAADKVAARAALASAAGEAKGDDLVKLSPRTAAISSDLNALEASIAAELGSGTTSENMRMTVLKKKVLELSQKEPQTAAGLIKTWLGETEGHK
ncbi:MAG: flagellar M-ring protein FliF [Acidobacteria bacterium]|nr:flagellar M-ring protein FliF [Acidobacteriota bacterium]MBI3657839.1 flagellar M-ring protein FliF [Acidobacteriota bacterium]